jgi:hypothetical protein
MSSEDSSADPHPELVSEQIRPTPGRFDAADLGKALPGLPAEFTWRDRTYRVGILLEKWKVSGPEVGRLGGEKYLRRHYFRVRTTDGHIMVIYCERHTKNRCQPKARWWLYTVQEPTTDDQRGKAP